MRSNIFKYIFIIVVIGLLSFAGYTIYQQNFKKKQNQEAQNIVTNEASVNKIHDMRLAIYGFDTINPILSTNRTVQDIDKLIFEPLLNVTKEFKLEPCLATEYSKVGDDSFVIRLSEKAKWHDGMALTAKDVKFTIEKIKEVNSIYRSNVEHISSVEIIDDHTVKLILDSNVPLFEYNLTFPIMAEHYYIDQDFVNTGKNKNPVGTGKYKIAGAEGNQITLKDNPNWWNIKEDLSLETININIYSSMGELYNAFKIGNIDLINTSNPSPQDYIGTIGFNTKELKGREFDFISFNTGSEIFSYSEVRKAVASAIDKNNIVASVFNNKYFVADFPLDYGHWLYDEGSAKVEYNLDHSKKLLEESGWTLKNGVWQKYDEERKKTIRLEFNLIVNDSNAARKAVAENIKVQLAQSGMIVNIGYVSDAQYNNYLNKKNYDMIIGGTYTSYNPSLDLYFGDGNLANYTTDEIKGIMNDVKSIKDEKLLKEKYKRLAEIYRDEVPYIGLYFNKNVVVYSPNLVGDIAPTWYTTFYNIEHWYRQ